MKFCWSTLRVSNMQKSLQFYQEIVGLSVEKQFVAGGGVEIAFLGKGETKVELIYSGDKKVEIGKDISWGFEVQSIDEKLEFVKGKGLKVNGPFSPNPHTTFFYVQDPNGLRIQFVQTN